MPPIKTVLACTDLTAESLAAVEAAAWLCSRYAARLVLVHVVDIPGGHYAHLVQDAADERCGAACEVLRERASRLEERGDFAATFRVEVGAPVAKLLEVIESESPDLVVCGRHKRSGWERVTLGSVAARLVYKVECDLLVATDDLDMNALNMAVATDFSPGSGAAAHRALELSDDITPVIHAIELPLGWSKLGADHDDVLSNVTRLCNQEADAWMARCRLDDARLSFLMEEDRPARLAERIVEERDINLFLCGATGATGTKSILLGGNARRILHHLGCSIWLANV